MADRRHGGEGPADPPAVAATSAQPSDPHAAPVHGESSLTSGTEHLARWKRHNLYRAKVEDAANVIVEIGRSYGLCSYCRPCPAKKRSKRMSPMPKSTTHARNRSRADAAAVGATTPPAAGRPQALAPPPFPLDDLEARRAWLWTLTFNIFQSRAAMLDKPDARFAMHLGALAGLAPAQPEARHGDSLGEFLDGLSVEAFAEYKQQACP
jgi:hypothetical protein